VIIVTGPLWLWSGEGGSWHFMTVPAEQAAEIRAHSLLSRGGFGSVKVEATIHDVTWRPRSFRRRAATTPCR
jgi:hypothetical protein